MELAESRMARSEWGTVSGVQLDLDASLDNIISKKDPSLSEAAKERSTPPPTPGEAAFVGGSRTPLDVALPVVPGPSSPFSELFPDQLLRDSGVDFGAGDGLVARGAAAAERMQGGGHSVELEAGGSPSSTEMECEKCREKCPDRESLMKHKRKHAGAKTHSCVLCGSAFTRQASLNKHVREKHGGNATSSLKWCPQTGCSFVTRNAASYQLHWKTHATKQSDYYYCKACPGVRYSLRRSLLHHLTTTHGSDSSFYGKCQEGEAEDSADSQGGAEGPKELPKPPSILATPPPKQKNSGGSMILHSTVGASSEYLGSAVVDLPPTTLARSRGSSVSSSGQPPVFHPSPVLSKPSTGSVGKTSFCCDRCAYSTRTFRALYAHRQREHAAEADVACMYCWRKFRSSDLLRAHFKTSHLFAKSGKAKQRQKKTHSCPKCDFSTSTKRVFTAHKKVHLAEEAKAKKRSGRKSDGSPGKRKHQRKSAASLSASGDANQPSSSGSSQTRRAPATLAAVSPHVIRSERPARESASSLSAYPQQLTLNPSAGSIPEELDACVRHLQEANGSLLRLARRRDQELQGLRSAVLQFLNLLPPSLGDVSTTALVNRMKTDLLQRCLSE